MDAEALKWVKEAVGSKAQARVVSKLVDAGCDTLELLKAANRGELESAKLGPFEINAILKHQSVEKANIQTAPLPDSGKWAMDTYPLLSAPPLASDIKSKFEAAMLDNISQQQEHPLPCLPDMIKYAKRTYSLAGLDQFTPMDGKLALVIGKAISCDLLEPRASEITIAGKVNQLVTDVVCAVTEEFNTRLSREENKANFYSSSVSSGTGSTKKQKLGGEERSDLNLLCKDISVMRAEFKSNANAAPAALRQLGWVILQTHCPLVYDAQMKYFLGFTVCEHSLQFYAFFWEPEVSCERLRWNFEEDAVDAGSLWYQKLGRSVDITQPLDRILAIRASLFVAQVLVAQKQYLRQTQVVFKAPGTQITFFKDYVLKQIRDDCGHPLPPIHALEPLYAKLADHACQHLVRVWGRSSRSNQRVPRVEHGVYSIRVVPIGFPCTHVPYAVTTLVKIADHVLLALQVLHGRGIGHADVRMDNIVKDGDRWVLIDLECMMALGSTPVGRRLRAWGPNGEALVNNQFVAQSDLWSLGFMLEGCSQEEGSPRHNAFNAFVAKLKSKAFSCATAARQDPLFAP